MAARIPDITGKRFGRLVVANKTDRRDRCRRLLWKTTCDCGKPMYAHASALVNGRVRSCGCSRSKPKHGMSGSPEYKVWVACRQRCGNEKDAQYIEYGGRGITVCDRWKNSFANFIADMGRRPSPDYSLDRIDNDKGYSPDNCKWSTKSEQNYNKRTANLEQVRESFLLGFLWGIFACQR